MGAVAVAIVVAPASGAVPAADNVQVGVVDVYPRIDHRDIDVHPLVDAIDLRGWALLRIYAVDASGQCLGDRSYLSIH